MAVVEKEISLPVVTFKRQRFGNKVYLRRIVTETLDQIQNACTAQENPKFKVMASRDVIVSSIVCEVKARVFFFVNIIST